VVDCIGLSSKESSSNGQVEDHEESLIEWLSDVIVWVWSSSCIEVSGQILSVIYSSIYQPLHLVSSPDELEGVEIGGEVYVESSWSRSCVNIVGPSRTVMNSSFYDSWSLSSSFDDVDLSTGCPASVNGILWHHPNGWPQVISPWKTSTDFELSVFPRSSVSGGDSRRGVLFAIVSFWYGLDGQMSISNEEIVGFIGVTLVFIVTTSIAVDLEVPLGSIERISIELVLPY
jgi:hypothetical protein